MQVINTNISSLNSQRHLNNTQSALSTSLERLSSGKRINNAKDDAAGLGISERMTSQINGMNQAIRNARDGISMSQTAEGALSTSSDMLQRIRTLAVQSSNATNASLDRQAIQDEVNELTAELNRIAQTTTFNGRKLLDGTLGTQNYQVGANAGDLITASGTNFQTNVYGNYRIQADGAKVGVSDPDAAFGADPAAGAFTAEKLTINGYLGSADVDAGSKTTTAKDWAASVNNISDKTGVTATARTEASLRITTAGSFSLLVQSDNAKEMTVSFTVPAGETGTGDGLAEAINAFNAISSKTGITAEFDVANKGIKLVNASGNDIKVANNLEAVTGTTGEAMLDSYKADGTPFTSTAAANLTAKAADGKLVTAHIKGVVTYDSEASFSLASTAADTSAFGIANGKKPEAATTSGSSKLNSVASLDLTTFKSAQLAIAICDAAINRIDKEMARYGALQSRFDATIKNLEVNSENTSNARSRIKDADYAAETAELSRATILQQAGTAMLAQANQRPQTVLSLIG